MFTLSRNKGTGGVIKTDPDSFIVEEITKNGTVLKSGSQYSCTDLSEETDQKGKFARFVLEKSNWNTIQALREIGRRFGRGNKSVGYAGMKDRNAKTTQLASIFGIKASDLARIHINDILINGAWQSSVGVETGDLLGNHFIIRISDASSPHNADAIIRELNGSMPNYFDKQRFGSRLNNHKVGLKIIKGDFEGAAMEFLTGTDNEINKDAVDARNKLREDLDFKAAMTYFPGYLKYERTVIEYLYRYEGNYANALRKLPRGILLMFIHAVEDVVFNYALSKRVEHADFENCNLWCKVGLYGFPDISNITNDTQGHENCIPLGNIIGYETKDELISDYEKEAMLTLGISKDEFKIKGMTELSSKGDMRAMLASVKDIESKVNGDSVTVSFSLPSGSYATVMMAEITKDYAALNGTPGVSGSI